MARFKEGDLVVRTTDTYGWIIPGMEFTVMRCGDEIVDVKYCDGKIETGLTAAKFDLVANNKTIMNKIGSMMKRILDADTQALYKAGIINGDLELTDAGRKALFAILFTANKVALVQEANEIIKEQEDK